MEITLFPFAGVAPAPAVHMAAGAGAVGNDDARFEAALEALRAVIGATPPAGTEAGRAGESDSIVLENGAVHATWPFPEGNRIHVPMVGARESLADPPVTLPPMPEGGGPAAPPDMGVPRVTVASAVGVAPDDLRAAATLSAAVEPESAGGIAEPVQRHPTEETSGRASSQEPEPVRPGARAAGRALAGALAAFVEDPRPGTDRPAPVVTQGTPVTDGEDADGRPRADARQEVVTPPPAPATRAALRPADAARTYVPEPASAGDGDQTAPDSGESRSETPAYRLAQTISGQASGQPLPSVPSPAAVTATSEPASIATMARPPAAGPPPPAGEADDAVRQLVSAVRIQLTSGAAEAKIRLRPEHLGEVRIELRVERDRVSAIMHVQRADVRAHIEGQAEVLRAQLAGQGLSLDELKVLEDGRQGPRQDARDEPREAHRRRQGRQQEGPHARPFVIDMEA